MIVVWSLPNPLKPGIMLRMKIYLEQRRQAMLQLHLSDQWFYCQLSRVLYYIILYIIIIILLYYIWRKLLSLLRTFFKLALYLGIKYKPKNKAWSSCNSLPDDIKNNDHLLQCAVILTHFNENLFIFTQSSYLVSRDPTDNEPKLAHVRTCRETSDKRSLNH